MSEAYVGEIRMFGFNFNPQYWQQCNGQLLPISQYQALFTLIGTFYGGNGTTSFGLPDLRSRVPIHQGQGLGLSNYVIGQSGGAETVALGIINMPQHNHIINATTTTGSNVNTPSGSYLAVPTSEPKGSGVQPYSTATPNVTMAATSLSQIGGSQAHNNLQPYLTINYCICITGIFPSRS